MKPLHSALLCLALVGFSRGMAYSFDGRSVLGAPACCTPAYSAISLPQGCCEFTPGCCQHVWDGYCGSKRLWGCSKCDGWGWVPVGRLRTRTLVGTVSCGEAVRREEPAVLAPPKEGPPAEPPSPPDKSGALMRLDTPPRLSGVLAQQADSGPVIPFPPTR